MKTFEDWVTETLEKGGEGYTGGKALELVKGFAEPLVTHFEGEIPALMRLREWDKDGAVVNKIFKAMEKEAVGDADKVDFSLFSFYLRWA